MSPKKNNIKDFFKTLPKNIFSGFVLSIIALLLGLGLAMASDAPPISGIIAAIVGGVIPKEFIGAVIGPGGKIIQEIQASTGATIMIEEVDNVGKVSIMSNDGEAMNAALARIKAITAVPEVGEVYKGKVKSIVAFGAFVEILPGKDGLLHISEIEWRRLDKVDEVLKEGDEIEVKLIDIDKAGKLKLSRKVLLPRPPKKND